MKKEQFRREFPQRSLTLTAVGFLACLLPTFAVAQAANGPVRLVRFSSVSGPVEWRPDANSSWSDASQNLPIREGAQVWVPTGARAEMQFDDGTIFRISSDSNVTLKSLYSDDKGEFTNLKLNQGHAYLRAPHAYSVFQIDTPNGSLNVDGPARLRLNVGDDVKVSLYSGRADFQNDNGTTSLQPHQYAEVSSPSASVTLQEAPRPDTWDDYNSGRDAQVFRQDPYVPANIRLVSGDMGGYGDWDNDPTYGNIWVPRESDPNWRPYSHGRWTWVEPFGWTWVGSEPWGWAPYHYGTWVHRNRGWGWRPGPSSQYWSPAVVNFTYGNGNVGWVPLDPSEVRYPSSLSVGFSSGNWSLFFSIGGAAVYYPDDRGYCSPRPWNNYDVNRNVRYTNITNVYNNTTIVNNGFVPRNSRFGGATQATLAGFRGNSGFRPMNRDSSQSFKRGSSLAFNNRAPLSGPPAAHPDARSFSPTRSFANRAPSQGVMNRPVFQATRGSFANPRTMVNPRPIVRGGNANTRGAIPANRSVANPAVRGASQPRWNPNARVNPAIAAAAARQSVGAKLRPTNRQASRPGVNSTQTSAQRAMGFGKGGRPTTNGARPVANPQRNAAGQPRRATGQNRTQPNRQVQSRPSQTRQTPQRQSPQRQVQPQRQAPQRQAPQQRAPQRQVQPRRQAPQRQAPQRQSPQRQAPQRQVPQRQAPQRQAPQQRAPQRQAPPQRGRQDPRKHGGG